MLKDTCAVCDKKLGITLFKYKLRDGKFVCSKCVRKNGYGFSPSYKSMSEVSLKELLNNLDVKVKKEADKKDLLEKFTPNRNIEKCIFIDTERKLFKVKGFLNIGNIYHLEDISGYEIVENGHSITSGGLGRAAIGGIAFGGASAIVGAVTGKKKNNDVVSKLDIKINMNSIDTPVLYINLINSSMKKNSFIYNSIIKKADSIITSLDVYLNKYANQNAQVESTLGLNPNDLRELKSLLDDGIITAEEYEKKKKQILDL